MPQAHVISEVTGYQLSLSWLIVVSVEEGVMFPFQQPISSSRHPNILGLFLASFLIRNRATIPSIVKSPLARDHYSIPAATTEKKVLVIATSKEESNHVSLDSMP
jgi:hypothetical protein